MLRSDWLTLKLIQGFHKNTTIKSNNFYCDGGLKDRQDDNMPWKEHALCASPLAPESVPLCSEPEPGVPPHRREPGPHPAPAVGQVPALRTNEETVTHARTAPITAPQSTTLPRLSLSAINVAADAAPELGSSVLALRRCTTAAGYGRVSRASHHACMPPRAAHPRTRMAPITARL
ncbi:hypothetical protein EVAR_194_1 [Eumeta japonica]|uniref:Uncharacterized protein n=1 Tax=Eumeta variegata TaxID=151549 RepID=A0A4C1S8T7_EUMVA|nr:hypothetical protein EVAR_194_1 [Eumeta japonica]